MRVNKYQKWYLFLAMLLGSPGFLGCATARDEQARTGTEAMQNAPPDTPTVAQAGESDGMHRASPRHAAEWGMEVLGLTTSAAGYMLDFRYRVTDPDKALSFMDRQEKPYLIDQATGVRLFVPSPPKVGPLRQTSRKPVAGRTYFVLFANPGRIIKPGDTVTVAVGDCRFENLIVQ